MKVIFFAKNLWEIFLGKIWVKFVKDSAAKFAGTS